MPGRRMATGCSLVIALLAAWLPVHAGEIHDAARAGDIEKARALLAADRHLANAKDENGQTPLHLAVRRDDRKMISLLVAKRADKEGKDGDGRTPLEVALALKKQHAAAVLRRHGARVDGDEFLHGAVERGDLDEVKRLLKENPKRLDSRDRFLRTPIFLAAEYGRTKIAAFLVAAGADVNLMNQDMEPPLQIAAASGRLKIASLLIDAGARVNVNENSNGTAPLHAAANDYPDIVQLLLYSGAYINARNRYGRTAMHKAAHAGNRKVLEVLMGMGADLEPRDERGWTPLHSALNVPNKYGRAAAEYLVANGLKVDLVAAAAMGDAARVRTLLKADAKSAKATDLLGLTPLHWAAQNGHPDAVRLLIDAGADVNAATKRGETPLHLAAARNRIDVARLLLDKGGNANARTGRGETPVRVAADYGFRDLVAVLAEKAEIDIHLAARLGRLDRIRELLAKDPALADARSRDGRPLYVAVKRAKVEAVKLLLDKGADVNGRNGGQWTALHFVAYRGRHQVYREIAELLIAKGADVNLRNTSHKTPLHLAAARGNKSLAELLIKHGADVNAKVPAGRTPLGEAINAHKPEVAELLRKHGAKEK